MRAGLRGLRGVCLMCAGAACLLVGLVLASPVAASLHLDAQWWNGQPDRGFGLRSALARLVWGFPRAEPGRGERSGLLRQHRFRHQLCRRPNGCHRSERHTHRGRRCRQRHRRDLALRRELRGLCHQLPGRRPGFRHRQWGRMGGHHQCAGRGARLGDVRTGSDSVTADSNDVIWTDCEQVSAPASGIAAPEVTGQRAAALKKSVLKNRIFSRPATTSSVRAIAARSSTLEMLGDASARHPLHRLVEPVEEPALDLVGEPAAVRAFPARPARRSARVGLADAVADGVPVDARPGPASAGRSPRRRRRSARSPPGSAAPSTGS